VKLRLPRVDRATAFIAVAAVALGAMYMFAATWVESRFADTVASTSSLSRSATGLAVWHDYLARLGQQPRLLTDFGSLPASGTVVAAGPFEKAPTDGDATAIAEWVRAGGRLVLVGQDAVGLAPQVDWGADVAAEATSHVAPVLPGPYSSGVGTIVGGPGRFHLTGPDWVPLYADGGGTAVATRRDGAGEIVWLADVMPVSNAGIALADDARFAVRLALAGGGALYFDEYHHGLTSSATAWSRVGPGGRAAIWLLLAAVAVLLLVRGRRVGPAIARAEVPAARGSAYIAQLAELYRNAGARPEALAGLEEGLSRAVARRYGTKEAGLARQPGARDALARSAALRQRGRIEKNEFVAAAALLRAARNEVEGGNG
jgi:hypothetical protein